MKKISSFFHKLCIPSEKNNYRAQLLHIHSLTIYVLFFFGAVILYKSILVGFSPPKILGIATHITTEELIQDTNNERIKKGLSPLTYNPALEKAAYDKAKNMFQYNYWAHYSPDGSTPWDFIRSEGYEYEYAGENLAKDFLFSHNVVDAWMASPTHRDNVLRDRYTEVGFAVVDGTLQGAPTTLVVQMFGAPLMTHNKSQSKVLAESYTPPHTPFGVTSNQSEFTLKKISFNSSLFFLALLLFVLIIDLYFAYKMRLTRITGKTLAHALFFIIVISAIFITAKGTIL